MNVRGWSTILYTPRILKNYTTNMYSAKKKKQKKQKDSTNRKQEREYFTSNSAIQK